MRPSSLALGEPETCRSLNPVLRRLSKVSIGIQNGATKQFTRTQKLSNKLAIFWIPSLPASLADHLVGAAPISHFPPRV